MAISGGGKLSPMKNEKRMRNEKKDNRKVNKPKRGEQKGLESDLE